MRRNNFALIFCSLLLLVFTACSQSENTTKQTANASASPNSSAPESPVSTSTKAPPADVVRAEVASVDINVGSSAEASVKLTIANGYHINANPPSFPYLIATALQFQPSYYVTVGTPVYPASVTRKFAFSKDPLAVYEGEVTIKVPLKAENKAPKGEHTMGVRVRVQPCDEEACYPPRTIETSLPMTIK